MTLLEEDDMIKKDCLYISILYTGNDCLCTLQIKLRVHCLSWNSCEEINIIKTCT